MPKSKMLKESMSDPYKASGIHVWMRFVADKMVSLLATREPKTIPNALSSPSSVSICLRL